MKASESIIIATTLHEPKFRLKPLIESFLPFIQKYHLKIIISYSPTTHNDVITYLKEKRFTLSAPKEDKRIIPYLDVVEVAINQINDEHNQRILYVDFDRLLHWVHNFPDEFIDILNQCSKFDVLHVGRTPRAFKTHPETQQYTERIVNQLGSRILGVSNVQDLISVCYSFTKNLAEKLISHSYPTEMGFYSSWPVILWSNAENKKYIEVDGQEWETPDRFQKEISEMGYDNWLLQFQTATEWRYRVKLLEDCILELAEFI